MTAQLIIYENESEDELLNEFIRLSALYPEYSPYDIAAEVFKGKVDPWARSMQAAQVWSNSLEVRERIRLAKANRNSATSKSNTIVSYEELQAEILNVTRDMTIPYQEKKVILEGLRLLAETNGWIKKAIEKKTEDVTRRIPNFLIKRYEDEQPARA